MFVSKLQQTVNYVLLKYWQQYTVAATRCGLVQINASHVTRYLTMVPFCLFLQVGGIGTLTGVSRGGGPSHGGGRGGSPMYHPLTWNAGITSPCGRGQGRGRGRGNKSSDRQLAIRASGGSSVSEAQPETVCAPAHVVQSTTTNVTRGIVVPAAWCDICRVGCNSKEILEQHKNGKKHKRTVQRMQDMARLQGITPAIADMGARSSTSSQLAEVEGPSNAVHMVPPLGSTSLGGEHKDLAPENVEASVSGVQITEVTGSSSKQNTTHHTAAVGHSVEAQVELHAAVQAYQSSNEMKDGGEGPPNATGPSNVQLVEARMDANGNKNGPKRKQTGLGRGGKKPRVSQAPRQRPERVREQPLVCTICNATCDTRAVFDIHLGGKKHQSRLKRSQGPDMLFGPLVAHIPPNQSAAHMTGAPEPLYYGFRCNGAPLVEQEAYLAGAMQYAFPVLPQAGPTIMAADYPAQQVTSNRCC